MKQLQEISEFEFNINLKTELIKIGKKNSNSTIFYKAHIAEENKDLSFYIANDNLGIKPQFDIFKNQLLIGNNDEFIVIDLLNNTKKIYKVFPVFYQFIIIENKIVIIGELSAFCLYNNQIIWKHDFDEIVDFYSLEGKTLFLKKYESTILRIDIISGKII